MIRYYWIILQRPKQRERCTKFIDKNTQYLKYVYYVQINLYIQKYSTILTEFFTEVEKFYKFYDCMKEQRTKKGQDTLEKDLP